MSSIIRIVAFSGCLREQSSNKAILRTLQTLLPQDVELEILALEDLPTFSAAATETEFVRAFKAHIEQADAVLISTPEYNGLLPHALRNALDWTAETTVLVNKPVAIMGVGRQSAAAQQMTRVRSLLTQAKAHLVDAPEVYLAGDQLLDEQAQQQLRALLDSLVAQVRVAASVFVH